MINRQNVLDHIESEIEAVKQSNTWPSRYNGNPDRSKVLDDLTRQHNFANKQDDSYFDQFDDLHDCLDDIFTNT